ncbi:MAG TPA: hypothetical protein VM123_02115 [archaeon]|nr:hypothetical protein [archaeon]
MNTDEIFFAEADYLGIQGIDTITKVTRYTPQNADIFLDGLELAEELRAKSGTILYPKDAEVTWERLGRLMQLRESNPNLDFLFKIKRSEKLFNQFRKEIRERMRVLLKRRQGMKIFMDLMSTADAFFQPLAEKILADENITLELFKIRFICDSAKSSRATFYADHMIDVALLSLAIATSLKLKPAIGEDQGKLVQIMKAAMFHGYGAIYEINKILETPEGERSQIFWEANRKELKKIASLELGDNVIAAIQSLYEYHAGKRDFISDSGWPGVMKNILIVASVFLEKERGLFGEPLEAKMVVDRMNVKVMEKQLNDLAVQALTLGLNLIDIFDFYIEMDRLVKKCPYDSAVPYPLTGFKSPTIFVCKRNFTQCRYLELSVNAVSLVKRLGDLRPGEYNRCKLLCPKLIAFYDEHYEEIKETTLEKAQKDTPKKGTAPGGGVKITGLEDA